MGTRLEQGRGQEGVFGDGSEENMGERDEGVAQE